MSQELIDDLAFENKLRSYIDTVLKARAQHEWRRDEELILFGTQRNAARHEMRTYGYAPFRAGIRKYSQKVWGNA